eukprot:gnl/Hemi2/20281_TR6726_c0_g1_i1.p2 gnl/Hemi2/20281_TR6726_c0_g1~~gnl/Hemi2/20281_TR6726_c0_g1_i1.p2  ORF type:complete len:188 (-),score=103.36 gnl/Hemi2/20281_TR6726_c0_g1_i1:254-817(-)
MLVQLVQQDRNLLTNVLPGLAESNPQLAAAIQSNPQEFTRLLNLGILESLQTDATKLRDFIATLSQEDPELVALINQNPNAFVQLLQGGGSAAAGPRTEYIQVTADERAAIERLTRLGFSRDMVLQAYIACERNEEITANYLLEHGAEDDMEGGWEAGVAGQEEDDEAAADPAMMDLDQDDDYDDEQ